MTTCPGGSGKPRLEFPDMEIDPAGLATRDVYRLMIGVIVPRPIAFVSTVSLDGVLNVAPFSYFMGVGSDPPALAFAPIRRRGIKKDTLTNVEATGEFVVNVVSEEIAAAMNLASGDWPPEVDEFALAGLTPLPSRRVHPPRVGEAPVSMECRVIQIVEVGRREATSSSIVVGEVCLFHVRDDLHQDGTIDVAALCAVGRLNGNRYCRVNDFFELERPRVGGGVNREPSR